MLAFTGVTLDNPQPGTDLVQRLDEDGPKGLRYSLLWCESVGSKRGESDCLIKT